MARLLIIILVAVGVYLLLRKATRIAAPQEERNPQAVNMRRCAKCGLHLPEGESVQSGGKFFCSEAHRDAFFKQS